MKSPQIILGLLLLTAFMAVGCRTVPHCGTCDFNHLTTSAGCECGDCGQICGDRCGGATCGDACGPNFDVCLPRFPFAEIRQRLRNGITCTAGCSEEVYWGEWFYDPPKCDPCDCFGNYIGPQGGPCRPGLLGVRRGDDFCPTNCGTCDTCTSCARQAEYRTSVPSDGRILYESEVYPSAPNMPPPSRPVPPSPSDQSIHFHGGTGHKTYPTSSGIRQPHRLGRGTH